jgi:hypothetical protein
MMKVHTPNIREQERGVGLWRVLVVFRISFWCMTMLLWDTLPRNVVSTGDLLVLTNKILTHSECDILSGINM